MPIGPRPSLGGRTTTGAIVENPDRNDDPHRMDSRASPRGARIRCLTGRRRLVDPTTCERDYAAAEQEFMQAMQEYKEASGRQFPTWSEVLEVLRRLGYEKPRPEKSSASSTGPTGLRPGRDRARTVRFN